VVLRGGGDKPNYDAESVRVCEQSLMDAGLAPNLVVDCSHGNSLKDYKRQGEVVENCVDQIIDGNKSIIGFMLESNLFEGNQSVTEDLSLLKYGVSVTDACIGWEETEKVITHIHERLEDVLPNRNS
jgi:3-deoxy-7-phosphoheptulonate synthase